MALGTEGHSFVKLCKRLREPRASGSLIYVLFLFSRYVRRRGSVGYAVTNKCFFSFLIRLLSILGNENGVSSLGHRHTPCVLRAFCLRGATLFFSCSRDCPLVRFSLGRDFRIPKLNVMRRNASPRRCGYSRVVDSNFPSGCCLTHMRCVILSPSLLLLSSWRI